MVVDGEPEEETTMTSPLSSPCRTVAWPHLCIIYGLLGLYGLWSICSYQLMRNDFTELQLEQHRLMSDLQLTGLEAHATPSRAVRRRRSASDRPVENPSELEQTEELGGALSRTTRESRDDRSRRRTGRSRTRWGRRGQRRSRTRHQLTRHAEQSTRPAIRRQPINRNEFRHHGWFQTYN